MLFSLLALATVTALPGSAMSNDAVVGFEQLCVGMFIGGKSDIDPARFSVTKIGSEAAKEIRPDLKGQTLWDVSGKSTDVHMLVHYEPTGMCVVEVAAADEHAIRENYAALVRRVANTLNSQPVAQQDRVNMVEGKAATTSMWRIKAAKSDIMLAITTYPEAKFMIQHLMTVSYVR
ncbi:MAG: hypothetical protein ABI898_10580 [Sphingomonadales bacterium]